MRLNEFSKSELKEILTKQGLDDIATWEYMTMSATKELGVYKLFIFVTYNTVEGLIEDFRVSCGSYRGLIKIVQNNTL